MKTERTIYRTENKSDYLKSSHEPSRQKFSIEAWGIFSHLLHKPDDWIITKKYCANEFEIGSRRVDQAFKELIDKGYIVEMQVKRTLKSPSGVKYFLYEEPITNSF